MDKMGLKEVRCIYKVHVYTFLLVKTNLYTFLYKKVISGIWSFFWTFFWTFFFGSRNSRYLILDLLVYTSICEGFYLLGFRERLVYYESYILYANSD